MRKAMDYTAIFVETTGNSVHILRGSTVVTPEHRVSDMIGHLDQARGLGVHKERRVGDVFEGAQRVPVLRNSRLSFCNDLSRFVLSRMIMPRCCSPCLNLRPRK